MSQKSIDDSRRPIPQMAIVLLALAVHGPLLLLQLPANSYDASTHIFFAAHYAKSWFNPWNQNWFAGFSQTTYPPLTHQWIALFSHLMGLTMAYMVVQLIVVLLLTVGVYRYSRLWVSERRPVMRQSPRFFSVRWRCWCTSRASCRRQRRRR